MTPTETLEIILNTMLRGWLINRIYENKTALLDEALKQAEQEVTDLVVMKPT